MIADNYIFTDTLDVLYENNIGADNVKGYHCNFDQVVMAVVTEKIRSINGDYYTYLYTPRGYQYSKDSEKEDAKKAYFEPHSDQTVYLYLPNISKLTRQFVYDNKEALMEYSELVLDLRGNYGGLLADFYRIADLFVEEGTVLGYEQTRMALLTHAVKAGHAQFFHYKRIVILQDGETASAAEGLIQALKSHVPGVVLMGETTFGKGIGQVTIPLTGGYAIRGTVLEVKGPGGGSIHRIGIAPDIPVDPDEDWTEKALAWLAGEN